MVKLKLKLDSTGIDDYRLEKKTPPHQSEQGKMASYGVKDPFAVYERYMRMSTVGFGDRF